MAKNSHQRLRPEVLSELLADTLVIYAELLSLSRGGWEQRFRNREKYEEEKNHTADFICLMVSGLRMAELKGRAEKIPGCSTPRSNVFKKGFKAFLVLISVHTWPKWHETGKKLIRPSLKLIPAFAEDETIQKIFEKLTELDGAARRPGEFLHDVYLAMANRPLLKSFNYRKTDVDLITYIFFNAERWEAKKTSFAERFLELEEAGIKTEIGNEALAKAVKAYKPRS